MKSTALLLGSLILGGCATAGGASSTSQAAASAPVTFVENDYPAALAQARKRGVPLFADAWAPWCHTCKFMRSYVFTDPALGSTSSRFVYLSIDTEQPGNAAFVERYPIQAWPTLMIIDPQEEKPVLTWLGSADVPQLMQLLGDGEEALKASGSSADSLALADRLAAQGKGAEAVEVYQRLLDHNPPAWSERGRVLSSMVGTLQATGNHKACAVEARTVAPAMARDAMFAGVATSGLQCALEADPPTDWSLESIRILQPLAEEALAIPNLLADDRSGVYETLVGAHQQFKDEAGAKALALQWLSFLEGVAAKADSPQQRSTFDAHRVEAAIDAGDPARAIPALEESERDQPQDYNPPARLALVYGELGKLDEALAASDRALSKVYGPRTLRLLQQRAQLLEKKGDKPAARGVLQHALELTPKLLNGTAQDRTREALEKKLADLKA